MVQMAKSLTDVVNLFRPAALTGEQFAFYQETAVVRDGARYEFHDGLYKRIQVASDHERLLVVGHGGCGKSTELLMLTSKLSNDGIPVILVEAKDDLDSVNFTLKNFSTEVFFRIESYLYPRVKKIYAGDWMARQDPELSELLYSGAVFEYNGDRWIDLHPLIRDYVREHQGVLDWNQ